MKSTLLWAGLAVALSSASAFAATATFIPTADGDVQTFGGDSVDTADDVLSFTQSGGLIRNAILEYDLSSIADTATIISATLNFTLTRFVSNTGTNNAQIDLFAYNGDGTVDLADFDASGTQVVDSSTPQGGVSGDVRSFAFTTVTPITAALLGNALTLRVETDSFASIQIAATEHASLTAPELTIVYDEAPPVPLPAGFPLLLGSVGAFAWMRRRKG